MSMGVYIPNVCLPEDGDFELWIAVKKDGSFTYNVSGGWRDGKQKAVPVQPHGRLIDADAFAEALMNDSTHDVWGAYASQMILLKISAAPTIIPAEEGET